MRTDLSICPICNALRHLFAYCAMRRLFNASFTFFPFRISCRTIIGVADTDKDGKITLEELTAWTKKSLKAVYKREANERLKKLDTNNDSKVSWEEYQKSKENIGGTSIATPPQLQAPHHFVLVYILMTKFNFLFQMTKTSVYILKPIPYQISAVSFRESLF